MTNDPAGWGTVAVATRIFQHPDPALFNCWSGLLTRGLRAGDGVIDAPIGQAAHHAANNVARAFMASGCDSLLTIDHDQTFAADTLERLRSDPRGEPYAMLSALYMSRSDGAPLVFRLESGGDWADPRFDVLTEDAGDWHRGDVVGVSICPLGFTLTRRSAFVAVGGEAGPWFTYLSAEATEDVAFAAGLERCGLRRGVHTGVPVGHIVRGVRVPYDDVEV